MPRRRRVLTVLLALVGLVVVAGGVHDLVLYRSLNPLPFEYCRVSEQTANERQIAPGELTTESADSGCREGEVHLCGYARIVLAEVIEERPQPC